MTIEYNITHCPRSCYEEYKIGKLTGIFIYFFLVFFSGCSLASANTTEINYNDAVKSIIGEAENQGYMGMLAVSHAIRNRGTLKGVYGLRSPRITFHLYSQRIYNLARLAWEQSAADFDITHNATNWENIKAFGKPYWCKNCIETFRYKDHVFYREAS